MFSFTGHSAMAEERLLASRAIRGYGSGMRPFPSRCVLVAAMLAAGSALSLAQAPAAVPPLMSRTRVIMLGTGVPIADPDRFGSAVVVLVDSTPYLFDAGVGVVRRWAAALRGGVSSIGPATLRTAFVTHLHSDHTLG